MLFRSELKFSQHAVYSLCNKEARGGDRMAKNTKQTSRKAASAASRVLRDGRTGKASKSVAGSALSQTPSRRK